MVEKKDLILAGLGALALAVVSKVKARLPARREEFDHLFVSYSQRPDLAKAVAIVESDLRPGIRGSAGEWGMMQIKTEAAQDMGLTGAPSELLDPAINIYYGSRYLDWTISQFGMDGGIHAYNVGPGAYRGGVRNWDYYNRVIRERARVTLAGVPGIGRGF